MRGVGGRILFSKVVQRKEYYITITKKRVRENYATSTNKIARENYVTSTKIRARENYA